MKSLRIKSRYSSILRVTRNCAILRVRGSSQFKITQLKDSVEAPTRDALASASSSIAPSEAGRTPYTQIPTRILPASVADAIAEQRTVEILKRMYPRHRALVE